MNSSSAMAQAFLLVLLAAPAAHATAYEWTNPVGGGFSVPGNWSPTGNPGSIDTCFFGLPSQYTVTFAQSRSVYYSLIYRGDVTFDAQGNAINWTATNSITNPPLFIRCIDPSGFAGLTLRNGSFSVGNCNVGENLGPEGRLTIGENATLQVPGDFSLAAYNGLGRLLITNGGQLNAAGVTFGGPQQNVATGHATVTGLGSAIHAGSIYISQGFKGSLLVDSGAITECTSTVSVGSYYGVGHAAVRGSGSILRKNGTSNITIGPTGNVPGTSRLAVLDGGIVISDTPVLVGANGSLVGNSAVQAAVSNSGNVSPGGSFDDIGRTVVSANQIGSLLITGAYTQASTASLNIELGGPALFDSLTVGGSAELAGRLNVSLVNGFTPQIGQAFPFLSSSSRLGLFTTLSLPALPSGASWSLQYSPTGASLAVVPAPGTCALGLLSLVALRRRRTI